MMNYGIELFGGKGTEGLELPFGDNVAPERALNYCSRYCPILPVRAYKIRRLCLSLARCWRLEANDHSLE